MPSTSGSWPSTIQLAPRTPCVGVQKGRPSLYAMQETLAACEPPVLIIAGDEDNGVLETDLMLKRTIPRCGLAVLPKSGHVTNLEEPALFNGFVQGFLTAVEHGKWGERDPDPLPVRLRARSELPLGGMNLQSQPVACEPRRGIGGAPSYTERGAGTRSIESPGFHSWWPFTIQVSRGLNPPVSYGRNHR